MSEIEINALANRILKDIVFFDKNIARINKNSAKIYGDEISDIIEMSLRYRRDSDFYMKNGDLITSFSCISYANGLLDAVARIINGEWNE
ncbi:MAG: DUF357 domain-containing protein [Candidatus Micrarchaeia archaeon]